MKRILTIAAIVVVVAVCAIGLYRRMTAEDPSKETQYKIATATIGTVKKTVTATGSLKPWAVVDIKTKAGGRVNLMKVDVGDVVKKGAVLAMIDPSDTLLAVQQARADHQSAIAKERQSDLQWRLQLRQTDTSIEAADASLASTKANLASARAQLDKARTVTQYQPQIWAASVGSAQASYDSAMKALLQLKASNTADLAAFGANADQAKANLANARANYGRQQSLMGRGFVSQQVVDSAKAAFEVAAAQLRSTDARVSTIDAEQTAAVAATQAKVDQAKAQLNQAKAQEVDVVNARQALEQAKAAEKQAEAQVMQQQAALDLAKANTANNPIRKLDISSANASIARAQASLVNANNTLDQTTVRAPSDGVIIQKYVEQGTIVSSALSFAATGNSIFQLGDITRMYVDVAVDETDIASVRDQMPVDLTFDAFQNITFEGKVIRIDPQAIIDQNVTTVHVRVEVDNTSAAYQLLKPGLNATCEFVDKRKDDILTVPSEAVHTGDNDDKYVQVATSGRPAPPDPKTGSPAEPGMLVGVKIERRPVVAPIEGNDSTWISSGLKEGEKVVTKTIEPVKQTATSPFAPSGPPRGMGGGRGR